MKKIVFALVGMGLVWRAAGAAEPQSGAVDPVRQALLAKVEAVAADPSVREEALRIGRERAVLCAHCHGHDGNSDKPEVPILAGQSPVYLLDQIERFATGKRKDFVMEALAGSFSAQDRLSIALYYSSATKRHADGDPALAAEGGPIFVRYCSHCHGADGNGTEGYARLAGQHPTYVVKTLTDFRDQRGDRNNPFMLSFTQVLSDDDIRAVAAYIATLR